MKVQLTLTLDYDICGDEPSFAFGEVADVLNQIVVDLLETNYMLTESTSYTVMDCDYHIAPVEE